MIENVILQNVMFNAGIHGGNEMKYKQGDDEKWAWLHRMVRFQNLFVYLEMEFN